MPGSESLFGLDDFQITNSLRFNDDDAPVLKRTFGTATNRKIWTFSVWVKRGNLSGSNYHRIISTATGNDNINFMNTDTLRLESDFGQLITTQLFRDISAWYHIVVAYDSTQGTAANRVKFFINGTQVTSFGTTNYPDQNDEIDFNRNVEHQIGQHADGGNENMDGYMAEMHWIDGAVKTPADFAETDSVHGHWKPIKYAGAYGDEGWYLDFKSSGVGTAGNTTVGADRSGNANHWTSTNVAATDQVIDTPTNNFSVMSPLSEQIIDHDGNARAVTFAEGNLKIVTPRVGTGLTFSSMGVQSGKWYCEVRPGGYDQTGERSAIGVTNDYSGTFEANTTCGSLTTTRDVSYHGQSGTKFAGNSESANAGAGYVEGDVIGVAINADDNQVTFYKNNASQFTQTLTGTDGTQTYTPEYHLCLGDTSAGAAMTFNVNFGQDSSFAGTETAQGKGAGGDDFYYDPPAGYNSLSTKNLPDCAVIPEEQFGIVTYTGNGGGSENVISGLKFKPGLVNIRQTSSASSTWVDALRGPAKYFATNSAEAEGNRSLGVKRFIGAANGGFALGDNNGTSGNNMNRSGEAYTAWCWNYGVAGATGGGTTSTGHSQSNIDTAFRANALAGQSVLTYTGDSNAGQGVAHGLGASVHSFWVKNREQGDPWYIYHRSMGNTKHLHLNTNDNEATNPNAWANYGPVSNAFTVNQAGDTNENNETYVAYAWEQVYGYSHISHWIGNGSSDGAFVYTGFRPKYILWTSTTGSENWRIIDSVRSPFNQATLHSFVSTTGAQSNETGLDILSNGFKIRTNDAHLNGDGVKYVYWAYADVPFKYANAR